MRPVGYWVTMNDLSSAPKTVRDQLLSELVRVLEKVWAEVVRSGKTPACN